MKPSRCSGSSEPTTATRFSSSEKGTGLGATFGTLPSWMCQAGLVGSGAARSRSRFAWYSSTARGITSKNSRFARCGAGYMNCASDSGGA